MTSSRGSTRWLGLAADYSPVERQIMQALPVPEQKLLHVLKSLAGGELLDNSAFTDGYVSQDRVFAVSANSTKTENVYTDPEDIPFGEPKKRTRPVYALVWTHRKSRVFKTKAKAQVKLKAWKRWYERQGWKVSSHSTGYFAVREPDATLQGAAAKGTERHAISLHEYDAETKERLK